MTKKLLAIPAGFFALMLLMVGGMGVFHAPSFPQSSQSTCSSPATSTSSANATSSSSGPSGKLTAAQVASYAKQAGFSGTDLVIAVAITMPESGATTTAVQNGGPIGAPLVGVGLWQITPGTTADLDPLTNAQHAYAKYVGAGRKFTPWTTYTGGQYLAWMAWAAAGVASIGGLAASAASASCTPSTGAAPIAGPAGQFGSVSPAPAPAGMPVQALFDGFPWGQCTYLAAWEFAHEGHTVNWSGNADEWLANAKAAGHTETSTPAPGDVVEYGSGGGYSVYGHVAIVVQVAATGGLFQVIEMDYLGPGQVDYRWDSTTQGKDIAGFIAA